MFCVLHLTQTQIGITETKIQEMIEQRLMKVEEIKFSLADIKVIITFHCFGNGTAFAFLCSLYKMTYDLFT